MVVVGGVIPPQDTRRCSGGAWRMCSARFGDPVCAGRFCCADWSARCRTRFAARRRNHLPPNRRVCNGGAGGFASPACGRFLRVALMIAGPGVCRWNVMSKGCWAATAWSRRAVRWWSNLLDGELAAGCWTRLRTPAFTARGITGVPGSAEHTTPRHHPQSACAVRTSRC
jgi:hypothetical protein